jgi:hypothetical protein
VSSRSPLVGIAASAASCLAKDVNTLPWTMLDGRACPVRETSAAPPHVTFHPHRTLAYSYLESAHRDTEFEIEQIWSQAESAPAEPHEAASSLASQRASPRSGCICPADRCQLSIVATLLLPAQCTVILHATTIGCALSPTEYVTVRVLVATNRPRPHFVASIGATKK